MINETRTTWQTLNINWYSFEYYARKNYLFCAIARTVGAYAHLLHDLNQAFELKIIVRRMLGEQIEKEVGSIQADDVELCTDESTTEKLVFTFEHTHIINESWAGITHHKLTITPSMTYEIKLQFSSDDYEEWKQRQINNNTQILIDEFGENYEEHPDYEDFVENLQFPDDYDTFCDGFYSDLFGRIFLSQV